MTDPGSSRFRGRRPVRVPAGLGCLVALVALPLALFAALATLVRSIFRPARVVRTATPRARAVRDDGTATALCEFVRKMALDDSFDEDEARTAGLPVERGATVRGLIDAALSRGWLERRGDRFAVTDRGRRESEALLHARGL